VFFSPPFSRGDILKRTNFRQLDTIYIGYKNDFEQFVIDFEQLIIDLQAVKMILNNS